MAEQKVVVNLATGLEDPERVTVAFLIAGAALDQGKQVAMFLTKEAVRLATPGVAVGVACEGCPPLPQIFEQFAEKGGELLACPFCVNSRGIDPRGPTGCVARFARGSPASLAGLPLPTRRVSRGLLQPFRAGSQPSRMQCPTASCCQDRARTP